MRKEQNMQVSCHVIAPGHCALYLEKSASMANSTDIHLQKSTPVTIHSSNYMCTEVHI